MSEQSHYTAPLEDIRFVIERWLDAPADWQRMPRFESLDLETASMVAEAAGQFCADALAPVNSSADLQGCVFDNGRVHTPSGYREAYAAYVEAGWPALACEPDAQGQGLPQLLDAVLNEMIVSANHGWAMYAGILHGAYACLHAHADEHLRQTYLPHLVSGHWLATMCITEPQAGSDVGLLRTQARAQDGGSYLIEGSKIFISGGEHDLTENIVHLVLARLPDAPVGTKGLSLFLVPKLIPQADGSFKPNAVFCDGIEKKMGIKGSATCAMRFDQAQGWLIGKPNQGLAAMFVMMNSARLHVGLQGLGHAEMARQLATAYAQERRQGRVQPRSAGATQAADLIALQPSVRRTLLDLRVWTEGMRAIGYWAGHVLDVADHAVDENERAQAHKLAALLTPVVKAMFTERGFQLASDALQVFGGYGYVHEYRIEQTLRDSRIAMIYEGTNHIQALDLLQRKVLAAEGVAGLAPLLRVFRAEADACEAAALEQEFSTSLRTWCDRLEAVTQSIREHAAQDREVVARSADDYLRLVGTVCMAFAWARAARVASHGTAEASDDPLHKCESASYFFSHGLPQAEHWLRSVEAARQPLPLVESV